LPYRRFYCRREAGAAPSDRRTGFATERIGRSDKDPGANIRGRPVPFETKHQRRKHPGRRRADGHPDQDHLRVCEPFRAGLIAERRTGPVDDDVKKNDIYDFMYTPNKGLSVLKNGKSQGVIPGLAFKKAFFGIWLSDSPVDKDLRKGMLAGK